MNFQRRVFWSAISIVSTCLLTAAQAEVKLASIFGDSMVLQRDLPVPIWGWAAAGEEVTVSLGEQSKTTTAGANGRWQIKLEALKADANGQTLKVSGTNTIELKDVLVGEVWICSGQSNMEWALGSSWNATVEVQAALGSTLQRARPHNVAGRPRHLPG